MSSISKWSSAFSFVALMALPGCERAPTMQLDTQTVTTGENVVVRFDKPISGRAANQYWITLLPVGAAESDATGRRFVNHGDSFARLPASQVGTFQVRLHDRFPAKEHHLIATTNVEIVPKGE